MATELKRSETTLERIEELLQHDARSLLDHKSEVIPSDQIRLPGPDFIDRVRAQSDRSPGLMCSLQSLLARERHRRTDQGIAHPAGTSFAPDRQYFDPANIVKRMIEGLERLSGWRGAFAAVAPLLLANIDNGDPHSGGPFSNAEGTIHKASDFYDRKLRRRRAEWELEREKILFFSLLVLLCTSMVGMMLALASASQISKIGAITALMGIVGAVLRQLPRTG